MVCLAFLSLPWPGATLVVLLCCVAFFEFASPTTWGGLGKGLSPRCTIKEMDKGKAAPADAGGAAADVVPRRRASPLVTAFHFLAGRLRIGGGGGGGEDGLEEVGVVLGSGEGEGATSAAGAVAGVGAAGGAVAGASAVGVGSGGPDDKNRSPSRSAEVRAKVTGNRTPGPTLGVCDCSRLHPINFVVWYVP